jgi:hypothetical protein
MVLSTSLDKPPINDKCRHMTNASGPPSGDYMRKKRERHIVALARDIAKSQFTMNLYRSMWHKHVVFVLPDPHRKHNAVS